MPVTTSAHRRTRDLRPALPPRLLVGPLYRAVSAGHFAHIFCRPPQPRLHRRSRRLYDRRARCLCRRQQASCPACKTSPVNGFGRASRVGVSCPWLTAALSWPITWHSRRGLTLLGQRPRWSWRLQRECRPKWATASWHCARNSHGSGPTYCRASEPRMPTAVLSRRFRGQIIFCPLPLAVPACGK